MKNLKISALAILAILAISSCSKDDEPAKVEPVNEAEPFTTIKLVLTPTTGTAVTLLWKDADAIGPGKPVITQSATFAQNMTYNGEITILDETTNPITDVNEEILEEAKDHQLFYIKTENLPSLLYTPAAEAAINYFEGKPVGLQTKFITTGAATGSLRIVLKHEGDKSAVGVANGDFTNATGSSDFDIVFPLLKVE